MKIKTLTAAMVPSTQEREKKKRTQDREKKKRT